MFSLLSLKYVGYKISKKYFNFIFWYSSHIPVAFCTNGAKMGKSVIPLKMADQVCYSSTRCFPLNIMGNTVLNCICTAFPTFLHYVDTHSTPFKSSASRSYSSTAQHIVCSGKRRQVTSWNDGSFHESVIQHRPCGMGHPDSKMDDRVLLPARFLQCH